MPEKTLWSQFHLGDNNPSPGGGILYALRYTPERVELHRDTVVSALQRLGVTLEDLGSSGIRAQIPTSETKNTIRQVHLLEELTVLNEATEYHDIGFNLFNSIQDLRGGLMGTYHSLLGAGNQAGAYELVDVLIPQIVYDISLSCSQGHKLSKKELIALKDLERFGKNQVELMNRPNGFVIIG